MPRQHGRALKSLVREPLGRDEQDVDLVVGEVAPRSRSHSSGLAELIVSARRPRRSAASIWFAHQRQQRATTASGPAPGRGARAWRSSRRGSCPTRALRRRASASRRARRRRSPRAARRGTSRRPRTSSRGGAGSRRRGVRRWSSSGRGYPVRATGRLLVDDRVGVRHLHDPALCLGVRREPWRRD